MIVSKIDFLHGFFCMAISIEFEKFCHWPRLSHAFFDRRTKNPLVLLEQGGLDPQDIACIAYVAAVSTTGPVRLRDFTRSRTPTNSIIACCPASPRRTAANRTMRV